MFTTNGLRRPGKCSDMVRVMEVFLNSILDTFSTLKEAARAATGTSDVFSYNNTLQISHLQLKKWVGVAWDQVSDLMELRRLAWVVTEVKSEASRTNSVQLYDDALSQVQVLLGKDFEVAMTVTLTDDHQQAQAKVNLLYVFANMLMIALFNYPKLWSLAKQSLR